MFIPVDTGVLWRLRRIRAPRPVRFVLRHVAERALRDSPLRETGSARFTDRHRRIVTSFLFGYTAALDATDEDATAAVLEDIDVTDRGFAYEGAAMALALLDAVIPNQPRRLRRFIDTVARPHVYMAHVGAGWAAARLRRSPEKARAGLDPLLDWLSMDGYGFHEGYFHSGRVVRACLRPRSVGGYAARAFDQGVGRSLWFVDGANVTRIADSIRRFDLERQSDLWSGVGLAAAYAGGVTADELRAMTGQAGSYVRDLAQGAAFAAEARARAGNPADHTEMACSILALLSAGDAATLVRTCRAGLADTTEVPAYEAWRQRVSAAAAELRGAALAAGM